MSVINRGDGPTDISPAEGLAVPEKGLVRELAQVPTSVSVAESQGAREVTIRQVGPLVLVLTGATFLNGAALTIPTAMGILGHTIPPGRVKNYSFAFYSGGAPMGQILGNLLALRIGLCIPLIYNFAVPPAGNIWK
ncbi:hypothetical protein M7I_2210 [Glarea lozoyensis 74030]|uniref:Uncharacterized protein n=1 Tax=Glarea lozoyensis (strain ATCC 74030 / MF5533) TaxID=1104152 RepID=H0EI60_GLAL7|nr:hypothetical protein M7I_2210 [Glarea lozoyensis 74030]